MLVVALIISELAARARFEAIEAMAWQSRTQALYGLARDLSAASSIEQVATISDAFVAAHLGPVGTPRSRERWQASTGNCS
jgi:two-component system, OmpR family, sensor histidine kinase KdpD